MDRGLKYEIISFDWYLNGGLWLIVKSAVLESHCDEISVRYHNQGYLTAGL